MKKETISGKSILTACLVLSIGSVQAQSSTVDVDYGVVTGVEPIEIGELDQDKSKLAMGGGGLVGGVLGYTFGKGSSKGKKRRGILLGAAAGALLGKEAAKDAGKAKAYQYAVELNAGDSVSITTEQARIDVGDCVTVERGESANIRRVSQVHCQDKDTKPSAEHIAEAKECVAAKAALSDAETDEALAAAVEKARIHCEE